MYEPGAGFRWPYKPPFGSQIAAGHPLSQGLVGCWLFNEAAGGNAFNVALEQPGTLGTGLSWVATVAGQNSGSAVKFDGTHHITVPANPAYSIVGPVSIVIDAYLPNVTTAQILLGAFSGAAGYQIKVQSGLLAFYDGNSYKCAAAVSAGVLVQLGIAVDGAHTYASINGVVLSTDVTTTRTGYAGALAIGDVPGGGVPVLSGTTISRVLIYNRTLSSAEMAWLYEEPYAMIGTPAMRRYWQIGTAVTGYTASASLAGVGLASPVGSMSASAVAVLIGIGLVTPAGQMTATLASALAGVGAVSGVQVAVMFAGGTLAGVASVVPVGMGVYVGSASVAGVGVLTGAFIVHSTGALLYLGPIVVTATGDGIKLKTVGE